MSKFFIPHYDSSLSLNLGMVGLLHCVNIMQLLHTCVQLLVVIELFPAQGDYAVIHILELVFAGHSCTLVKVPNQDWNSFRWPYV